MRRGRLLICHLCRVSPIHASQSQQVRPQAIRNTARCHRSSGHPDRWSWSQFDQLVFADFNAFPSTTVRAH